jgi:hypothetical protein
MEVGVCHPGKMPLKSTVYTVDCCHFQHKILLDMGAAADRIERYLDLKMARVVSIADIDLKH